MKLSFELNYDNVDNFIIQLVLMESSRQNNIVSK